MNKDSLIQYGKIAGAITSVLMLYHFLLGQSDDHIRKISREQDTAVYSQMNSNFWRLWSKMKYDSARTWQMFDHIIDSLSDHRDDITILNNRTKIEEPRFRGR